MRSKLLFFVLVVPLGLAANVGAQAYDHYSIPSVPLEVEKRRLADVAIVLKQHPEKVVYLVGYNQIGKSKTTATKRLSWSRRFLIQKQHIAPERIKTVYSGAKPSGLVMDIFFVDRDAPISSDQKALQDLKLTATAPTKIEPGVSHDLAVWRAAHYSDICYKLDLTLEKMSPVLKGTIEIHVKVTQPGSVPPAVASGAVSPIILDWRRLVGHEKDSTISNITINGVSALLDPDLRLLELTPNGPERAFYESNGHLVFRDGVVAGENIIKLDFTSPIVTTGSAIMRQIDKNGSEYLYSHFTHGNVSTAFPVFDQPDLKARFQLSITTSAFWGVVSNTSLVDAEKTQEARSVAGLASPIEAPYVSVFEETKPISIYDFRFKAGPKK